MWWNDDGYVGAWWGSADWDAPASRTPEQIAEDEAREWLKVPTGDDRNVGVLGTERAQTATPFTATGQDHGAAWTEIVQSEGPVSAVVTRRVLVLRRDDDPGFPGVPVSFDANREEREEWKEWARRRHPEWGRNPKPPRRLAPRLETRIEGKRDPHKAGVIVLVVHQDYEYMPFKMDGYGVRFDHTYVVHQEGDTNWEIYRMCATSHEGWRMEDKSISLRVPGTWVRECGDLRVKSALPKNELLALLAKKALAS